MEPAVPVSVATTASALATSDAPSDPAAERPAPPSLRTQRLLLAGLLLLSVIPALGGAVRLESIASGGPVTADNARFLAVPVPVVLHIVAALLYSTLGAWQVLPLSRRGPSHRMLGRYVLVPAAFTVALSGLWMTATYTFPAIDGTALALSRWAVGLWMLASLVLARVSIGRRDHAAHGAWMLRAYAVAMGAGTQVLTSLPPLLLFGPPDELGRLLQMDLAWAVNIVVAEVVLARWIRPRRAPRTA